MIATLFLYTEKHPVYNIIQHKRRVVYYKEVIQYLCFHNKTHPVRINSMLKNEVELTQTIHRTSTLLVYKLAESQSQRFVFCNTMFSSEEFISRETQ